MSRWSALHLGVRTAAGPNEHANVLGYGVIANTFLKTYIGLSEAGVTHTTAVLPAVMDTPHFRHGSLVAPA